MNTSKYTVSPCGPTFVEALNLGIPSMFASALLPLPPDTANGSGTIVGPKYNAGSTGGSCMLDDCCVLLRGHLTLVIFPLLLVLGTMSFVYQ